jgi:phytoene/squalene synthetase
MNSIGFYQAHLDRVSRSFAFCIARLDGDLRYWVSHSYLLCRILDTVEDAPWKSAEKKAKSFHFFEGFLAAAPNEDAIQEWAFEFPPLPEHESKLLQDAYTIFRDFHSLPSAVRQKILRSVLNMSRGMRHFSGAPELRLRSLSEVNQYCFFVAGLVGELLTDLVGEKIPAFLGKEKSYASAHHFGLFLQKINLLKDQAEDEKQNRFLVPSRPELLNSLRADAQGAIAYLQSLPISEKGFRLFCAWSLFLGLASLPWIQKAWARGIFGKIPRLFTEKLLTKVEQVIDDNNALIALFHELLPPFAHSAKPVSSVASLEWFEKIYEGSLSREHLIELGMI